ncbi:porin family protein [Thermocoleostomius sinensis]|uniref:Porin family protein n=1 Tax=Thermocoleostomius sinensis A174 TaxID=2016057 RepID=A0A9E8ZBR4_9CYAN|nr:hypothetical protein [Thermocoleostomius sinensis]WAL60309.1 hypothetical protein OXH18_24615 [Thermocoleostomius sinensis A174]
MKRSIKVIATTSIVSAMAVGSILFSADRASAQVRGMEGSYLGGGVSAGVTNVDEDGSVLGGNIQGRLDARELPVSLRGAFLFNGDNSAIMPIVSYDVGVAPNTNLYVGGGYSFVLGRGESSLLGNQDAPVVTLGVETAVNPNVVLYGDAKLGIDAYKNSSGSAVSLQLGAAYRF